MNDIYVFTQYLTDQKGVTHLFNVAIDAKELVKALAPKALANKSKQSRALKGAVKVKLA